MLLGWEQAPGVEKLGDEENEDAKLGGVVDGENQVGDDGGEKGVVEHVVVREITQSVNKTEHNTSETDDD